MLNLNLNLVRPRSVEASAVLQLSEVPDPAATPDYPIVFLHCKVKMGETTLALPIILSKNERCTLLDSFSAE